MKRGSCPATGAGGQLPHGYIIHRMRKLSPRGGLRPVMPQGPRLVTLNCPGWDWFSIMSSCCGYLCHRESEREREGEGARGVRSVQEPRERERETERERERETEKTRRKPGENKRNPEGLIAAYG